MPSPVSLVPGDELRRVASDLGPFDDLANLPWSCTCSGTSVYFATIRVRLLQERLISQEVPTRVLLLARAALERSAITLGDAAEVLGTSTEEIRQLITRPRPADDERRAQQDLEAAAFADRER